jgi:hypothetical protein
MHSGHRGIDAARDGRALENGALRPAGSAQGKTRILKDAAGVEWECVDITVGRSSYATYRCRRLDIPDAKPRLISVPRSWNLDDPSAARRLLG